MKSPSSPGDSFTYHKLIAIAVGVFTCGLALLVLAGGIWAVGLAMRRACGW